MKLFTAEQMARTLISEWLGNDWTFQWNNRKRSFGVCRYRSKTIGLSRPLTIIETEDHVRNTILHEIAHAAVGPGHGHDKVWKKWATVLGVKDPKSRSRSSNPTEFVKPKWVAVVGSEIVKHYHRRPNRDTFYKCQNWYIPGRRAETFGKINIMSYAQYERVNDGMPSIRSV